MGACYNVNLKVSVKDMAGAVAALQALIANDKRTNYALERYAERGITTDTFDNLMKIFLADWDRQSVDIKVESKWTRYSNGFNAHYGWEAVMMDMFHTIAPFVADNSELVIYPDFDYDKLVVRDGKCVQLH